VSTSSRLRAAVNQVHGPVPVQRCIRHKERNVLDHLPERDRPTVKRRLRTGPGSSQTGPPHSTGSGPSPASWSAASTNPIESMIGTVRRTSRNVKHRQNGDTCLRWTAAGMLEAERQFREIIGYNTSPDSPSPPNADAAERRAVTIEAAATEPAATPATAR
jgi:transposase-like protein